MYCASDCGKWIAKALNVDFVRKPILGHLEVSVRLDGRFGLEDPVNWPQAFCPSKPHLGMIPYRPDAGHPAHVLWETLRPTDFIAINDDPQGTHFGRISAALKSQLDGSSHELTRLVNEFCEVAHAHPSLVSEARRLEQAFRDTLRLFYVPFTYRDSVQQWGHLHRTWVECWAFMRYQRGVQLAAARASRDEPSPVPSGFGRGVMGVFTSDPRVAQKMYMAGVPVWYLQPRHLRDALPPAVRALTPANVVQGLTGAAHFVRYTAPDHIEPIWAQSSAILDVEHVPLPADHTLAAPRPAQPPPLVRQLIVPPKGK